MYLRREDKLPSRRLTKEDLFTLLEISKEGFRKESKMAFSTEYKGKTVKTKKLKELLNSDLPSSIHNFSMEIRENWKKKVEISFSRSESLSRSVVEGQNKTWVEGRQRQILDFINKKERTYYFIFHRFGYWIALTFFALAYIAIAIQFFIVAAGCFFIFLLFLLGNRFAEKLFPHFTIEVEEKRHKVTAFRAFILSIVGTLIVELILHFVFGISK